MNSRTRARTVVRYPAHCLLVLLVRVVGVIWQFLAVVAVSAIYDVLAITWHRARERGQVLPAVLLGCAMEASGLLPIAISIATGDYWILLAGVIGSAIGIALGMHYAPASRRA